MTARVGRDLVVVAVEDGLAVHDPLAHLPAVGAGERFEVGAELLADRLVPDSGTTPSGSRPPD